MNRINPAPFSAAFTAWVRETWPDRPEFVAIDVKTSRRSHDRAAAGVPLHLVSASATTSRLVLGQEAVPDKANELTAIPVLLARLSEQDGLRGALVSIDAIGTNATIATAITAAGADYLLAVKANQPAPRADIKACFNDAPPQAVASLVEHDKGRGLIERSVSSARSIGCRAIAAFQANSACRAWPAWSRSRPMSNEPARREGTLLHLVGRP